MLQTSTKTERATDVEFLYNEIRRIEKERDEYKKKLEEKEEKWRGLKDRMSMIYGRVHNFRYEWISPEKAAMMKKSELNSAYKEIFTKFQSMFNEIIDDYYC